VSIFSLTSTLYKQEQYLAPKRSAMSAIYILSDKGKLSKEDERIVFTQPDDTKTILFPFKMEQLVLMGNVSISGDALRMLTKYRIPVTLLSANGKFNGKLVYGDSKNVFLRQKQYLLAADEDASLEIAKQIVVGKIRNQVAFMQRIKRTAGKDDSSDAEKMKKAIEKVKRGIFVAQNCKTKDSLRGTEGISSREYFSVFSMNIIPEWAVFDKRSRNPPQSNVNAVLSFLYTLLAYRVESAIEAQGLDSMVGNLHLLNYSSQSLVFDLMEEFRSPIADTVCCSLFNLKQLTPEDFEEKVFSSDDDDMPFESDNEEKQAAPDAEVKGILLTKEGLKKVIAAFEEKMETCVNISEEEGRMSYQRILFAQAAQYKRVISGEQTKYHSFSFK